MNPAIVPATPEILTRFYGQPQRCSVRALAAVLDGEPICIAGTCVQGGRKVMFADVRDEMRRYPKTGVRMAKKVMDGIRADGVPVAAMADEGVESARRFLEYLGFQPVHDGVYAWRA